MTVDANNNICSEVSKRLCMSQVRLLSQWEMKKNKKFIKISQWFIQSFNHG